MQIRLSEGLIYSSLVGAKCSTSLEQQDNLLELRPCVFPGVGLVQGHTELLGLPAALRCQGVLDLQEPIASAERLRLINFNGDHARRRGSDDRGYLGILPGRTGYPTPGPPAARTSPLCRPCRVCRLVAHIS